MVHGYVESRSAVSLRCKFLFRSPLLLSSDVVQSNGPFELLPVLAQFFGIAGLPPGSLKLKSYAGRSIFSGLVSAPASKKRAGVVEVLNSFEEDSHFILIGDSGEQDLELYAE